MPSLVTMAQLEARVRQHANMELSAFVSSDEIRRYLLSGLERVRDELLASGQEVQRSTYFFNTTAGTHTYPLPEDFYRLLAVIAYERPIPPDPERPEFLVEPTDGNCINLGPFMMQEMAGLLSMTGGRPFADYQYRLGGTQLVRSLQLLPRSTGITGIRVEYLTALGDATSDATTFDGLNGFEQIAVLEAAAMCLSKEESDARPLLAQAAAEWERLRSIAPAIDRSRPERVVDVLGITDDWADSYGSSRGSLRWGYR